MKYCIQCGRKMREKEVVFYDCFQNPVCDDCMIGDSDGAICPRCGRKVPHEYMASDICRQCAKEED